MADDDKFLTVRLDPDVYEDLRALADRNDRTIAGEVRLAIKERLERDTDKVTA